MSKRTALVTGGTGGLGTAICKSFAERGDIVVACHLPQEIDQATKWQAELLEDGFTVNLIAADVADFDQAQTMITDIEKQFGWVDILVNCAGITRDSTLRKMTSEDWDAVLNVNLSSVFNVTRHVIEGMIERGFGRIVNISSVNGQRGQFGQTNYSAAKAGMHGFTMALAQEAARKGVTVNSVSPGYIDTSMTAAIPEDIRTQIVSGIPVGRMGQPDDIAHTIAFLTDEKSSYITGANIPVNGGLFMSF
ncbi:MAG: acetoacetyl-CoA reductase [Parasphingorhabdus sp.]|jgi:acetoacetyl-CoA reductase